MRLMRPKDARRDAITVVCGKRARRKASGADRSLRCLGFAAQPKTQKAAAQDTETPRGRARSCNPCFDDWGGRSRARAELFCPRRRRQCELCSSRASYNTQLRPGISWLERAAATLDLQLRGSLGPPALQLGQQGGFQVQFGELPG